MKFNTKSKQKKLIALVCLSAFLTPLLISHLIADLRSPINEIDNQSSIKDKFIPKTAWYNNSEAPIEIDALTANDWTWARTQPWCRKGDGSWGDPYVIY